MRRVALLLAALTLTPGAAALAHDLFVKLASYFVAPGATVSVETLNGTFTTSENAISRDRIADLSVVSAAGRTTIDTARVQVGAKTSRIPLTIDGPGTYVVGLSTRPRELELAGREFQSYLAEEGLTDVIEARRTKGIWANKARERYAKHVKAIFQAGDRLTDQYGTTLGYDAEIVPLENPYGKKAGDGLRVRAIFRGAPASGVTLLAGGRTAAGRRIAQTRVRTGSDGVATIQLTSAGTWYVKFIRMLPVTGGNVDYESTWATLSFGLR